MVRLAEVPHRLHAGRQGRILFLGQTRKRNGEQQEDLQRFHSVFIFIKGSLEPIRCCHLLRSPARVPPASNNPQCKSVRSASNLTAC